VRLLGLQNDVKGKFSVVFRPRGPGIVEGQPRAGRKFLSGGQGSRKKKGGEIF